MYLNQRSQARDLYCTTGFPRYSRYIRSFILELARIMISQIKSLFLTGKLSFWTNFSNVIKRIRR
jgi:hypothetical protein